MIDTVPVTVDVTKAVVTISLTSPTDIEYNIGQGVSQHHTRLTMTPNRGCHELDSFMEKFSWSLSTVEDFVSPDGRSFYIYSTDAVHLGTYMTTMTATFDGINDHVACDFDVDNSVLSLDIQINVACNFQNVTEDYADYEWRTYSERL